MNRKATRSLLGAVAVAGALALAACGSDDTASTTTAVATTAVSTTTAAATTTAADAATTTAASTASTPAAFAPVTIAHKYGSTTVDERPQRIVSLDQQWTDVLLALDTVPVGYIGDSYADGPYPWRGDMLASATEIDATNAIPFEQVAALQPDLIVITWQAQDVATYQKLSAIAPTVAALTDATVDPWPDLVAAAGQVLGDEDAAAALTDRVQADVAGVADGLPGLQGKTFTFANVVAGDGIYVLTDPKDGAIELFNQLGLVVPTELATLGAGADGGRVKISFEQSDLLDADLMLLLGNGTDPATVIPGFADFAAVQNGASSIMSYVDIVGLNTPSPLSIPYSLEKIRPALGAAAAAQ